MVHPTLQTRNSTGMPCHWQDPKPGCCFALAERDPPLTAVNPFKTWKQWWKPCPGSFHLLTRLLGSPCRLVSWRRRGCGGRDDAQETESGPKRGRRPAAADHVWFQTRRSRKFAALSMAPIQWLINCTSKQNMSGSIVALPSLFAFNAHVRNGQHDSWVLAKPIHVRHDSCCNSVWWSFTDYRHAIWPTVVSE